MSGGLAMDSKELIMAFADAIDKKQVAIIRFIARDAALLTRQCAPLDYGISRRAKQPVWVLFM